jgi:hypothetical protein
MLLIAAREHLPADISGGGKLQPVDIRPLCADDVTVAGIPPLCADDVTGISFKRSSIGTLGIGGRTG